MAVYKDSNSNTWRAVYRYTDWNGERKQTQKRGFQTKREAQAWEREQLCKTSSEMDMTFSSFAERYTDMGNERAHSPDEAAPVFRKAEDEQHHAAAGYYMAERSDETKK